MTCSWDEDERRLRERAMALRTELDLDDELAKFGVATLTGSSALRLMVARDIDLTVTVPQLGPALSHDVALLATRLLHRPAVREVLIRDDTGSWNTDPNYPDGVYLHVVARDPDGDVWTVDVWFVDEPARQPDLKHLRTILPRITPQIQQRILAIKRASAGRRADGSRLPSFEIYQAVLDRGAQPVDDVRHPPETHK